MGSESGIYIIVYKKDPKVYYIGQASNFKNRFTAHSRTKTQSKFHKLLRLEGWGEFSVGIIELCPREKLGEKENYYLNLYKPLLNSIYSTSTVPYKVKHKANRTLSSELLTRKNLIFRAKRQAKGAVNPVYVYGLNDKIESVTFFKSVRTASRHIGCAPITISNYLDTAIPFQDKFFFSQPITKKSILHWYKSTSPLLKNLLTRFSAIKVWAYDAYTLELIEGSPFSSKNKAATDLDMSMTLLNFNIDKSRACGKGVYLFSRPLKDNEIQSLLEKSDNLNFGGTKKIWAYDANSLELINSIPFAKLIDAAAYFRVRPSTIAKHTDTEKATIRKGILVYFFSRKLDSDLKAKLKKGGTNIALSRHFNQQIWVYTEDTLELVNDAPFPSVKKASSFLETNAETIKIHLDTEKSTKLRKKSLFVYFFSHELNSALKAKLLDCKPRAEIQVSGRKALWVYNANTLELINNAPFPSRSLACPYFNTHLATIQNNLDTRIAVKLKKYKVPVYFFSYELDSKLKEELSS